MAYLIQGYCFAPSLGGTPGGYTRLPFAGEIRLYSDGNLFGEVMDETGQSYLRAIVLSEGTLEFVQDYGSAQCFHFVLHRQGGTPVWIGKCEQREWEGPKGMVKCILTEVPDDFFVPPNLDEREG